MNVYILKVANLDFLNDENRREHLCTALDAGSVYGTLAAAQAAAQAAHQDDWQQCMDEGEPHAPPEAPALVWDATTAGEWSVFVEETQWWYAVHECEVQS